MIKSKTKRRLYHQAYYQAHREEIAAKKKAEYLAKRKEKIQKAKDRYHANREKIALQKMRRDLRHIPLCELRLRLAAAARLKRAGEVIDDVNLVREMGKGGAA